MSPTINRFDFDSEEDSMKMLGGLSGNLSPSIAAAICAAFPASRSFRPEEEKLIAF
jgi:hypothetical protein